MTMLPMGDRMPLNLDPSLMQTGKVKNRGGMFGGGWGDAVSAILTALSAGTGSPIGLAGMQMLTQRLGQKREDQQYQRQRQDSMADWQAKQQWELEHAQPNYGEFERALIGKGVLPGTPQWQEAMGTRVNNMLDPMTMTIYGPMPRSALMGGGQQAPAKPLTDEDILRMQGGPAAQPPATFPRPY